MFSVEIQVLKAYDRVLIVVLVDSYRCVVITLRQVLTPQWSSNYIRSAYRPALIMYSNNIVAPRPLPSVIDLILRNRSINVYYLPCS